VIYAKLEGLNPTGSIKDRIALSMIQQAEISGKLTKGKTIIEPTSGNTGVALAMIGSLRGYEVEIIMSSAVSVERRQMIQAFGGKVTLTDGKLGTDGAIRKAREMVKETRRNTSCRTSFPMNSIKSFTTGQPGRNLETDKRQNRLFCFRPRHIRHDYGCQQSIKGT